MPAITTCLWFDGDAHDAAEFYVSVFPNSRITDVSHYGADGPQPAGSVLMVTFDLDGRSFMALNGGPQFTFSEAVSFAIDCADQTEADHYWDALTDGGEESQCGWLKDRYGVSWQVVPSELVALLADPDADRARRAMMAMFEMKRIDIAAVRAAADAG